LLKMHGYVSRPHYAATLEVVMGAVNVIVNIAGLSSVINLYLIVYGSVLLTIIEMVRVVSDLLFLVLKCA